ncbi:WD40 repeat domain-containing protein [Actinomadura oligospora]|uniref:WD40 repeat domain-containing protein n=1 Tax=Actinomadura oligospora TaxID=111804 RepID=UPI0004B06ABD|nr:WD40 repeat domain-containing protein [Actinomadura oligospora]
MITSKPSPAESPICHLGVVHHAGAPLVVCAERWGGVLVWSPADGEWTTPRLAFAHREDPAFAEYPDAHNELDKVAALSADGRLLLAAGGDEQEPAVWNVDSGELVAHTPSCGAYTTDIVALDDRFVTAQQYSEEVRLWSPDGTDTLLDEVGSLFCLASAQIGDRTLLLTGGSGVTVWDAATLTELGNFYPAEDERVWAVAACSLGRTTAIIGLTEECMLHAWSLDADDPDEALLYDPVELNGADDLMVVIHVDGRPLVVNPTESSLHLLDAADGTTVGHVPTPGHSVTAMKAATVDGRPVLVTGGDDGILRIWDETDLTQALHQD